jgi:hypothetical protein
VPLRLLGGAPEPSYGSPAHHFTDYRMYRARESPAFSGLKLLHETASQNWALVSLHGASPVR